MSDTTAARAATTATWAWTAVVVLSNLPPSERLPATVLGVKLLEELA